mmetsp:Transcript_5596/g.13134  ORF Transcript_5596/g.13134 Transcript_5596/m.13134 type:complete len:366 (-) Transcript_5596:415-1512(-)|eukprot:CAMPEP_0206465550 /NCGR_PEP_ID=MMETSP0324_2-20121206/27902_1 /ASSEMBLY_ACC=CAM_ASM_000836 /TAXON_ID=2866 /ORGANISM="Crypthecodinium cohnii, Strain Seligo" /LENGTH=365 /DNA_ID=CAMNT_0053938441 /DNA_START=102 /DNA_END=1199 /DNA_ORIENTATION=-
MSFGRPDVATNGVWDSKQVDPHQYLLGRERPIGDDKEAILGRGPEDASVLFPVFSAATVTTTGEVVINGKTLNLWTFQQLETLSIAALRQRANKLKEALGEGNCKPIPSAQKLDTIRWILDTQSELTNKPATTGRGGMTGRPSAIPSSFVQETAARTAPDENMPFGPRRGQAHTATRDHYGDLIFGRNEFGQEANSGIVSNREGGEGRRHLQPQGNMTSFGVSNVDADHESPRKRWVGCDDHLMQQKNDLQAGLNRAVNDHRGRAVRTADNGMAHPTDSALKHWGIPVDNEEAPIGGERRRHAEVPDRMVNAGVADPGETETQILGRKHLDGFRGSASSDTASTATYQSAWRKDPFRLKGSSMLC